jgi:2-(1,2-epoxy-1,2-dihydrophenyl)acetyl-CoA isomerase
MSDQVAPIKITRDGAVAIVVLDRPAAGNAIDVATARALLEAAVEVSCDWSVRAVLIASDGRLFSAGGDLNGFASAAARFRN